MKSKIILFMLVLILIGTTIFSLNLYNHKGEVKITLCDEVQEGMIFVTKINGSVLNGNLTEDEPIDITKLDKLNIGDKIRITHAEGVIIKDSMLTTGKGFYIFGLATGDLNLYLVVDGNIEVTYSASDGTNPNS